MLRVIGLDIGSYSIKAVELIHSLSSYEITGFHEKILPVSSHQHTDSQAVYQAMAELFHDNNLEADRIITAMPGQHISSRMLTLPFSEPRKVAASIYFEVEDLVPFTLDDMIIDHQILATQKSGKSQVLVAMIQKKLMKQFLDQLAHVNIDPKIVDVDSLAFFNMAHHIPNAPDELYGLVDFGHEKTSVCIMEGDMLRMFRTLNVGGKYITEVMARDLEISFEASQQMKHELSAIASEDGGDELGLNPEQLDIARKIGVAGYGFTKDLARTLFAFKSQEKQPLSKIIISGGTTRLNGFDHYLESQIHLPVQRVDLSTTDLKIHSDLQDYAKIIPQAISIGLRAVPGQKKTSRINLRRGEFAYSQDSTAFIKTIAKASLWLGAGSLMLIVAFALQAVFYHFQTAKFDQSYRQTLLQIDPTLKTQVNKTKSFRKLSRFATTHLQTQIADKNAAVQSFLFANTGSPPLQALLILSEIIPAELKVDLVLYDYSPTGDDTGKLIIQGETDGYSAVTQIKDLMINHPNFEEVSEKSGSKPGSDGKVIAFTIESIYLPDSLLSS